MMRNDDATEKAITDILVGEAEGALRPVTLRMTVGDVECRYYAVDGSRLGAIWVGGIGGGFDSPARGLYPALCEDLMGEGIASLRLRYRHPTILEESTLDVLAGIAFLESQGVELLALTGHSFGGAVVIHAASAAPNVRGVVTLATQSYGTEPVRRLGPDCSILMLHGGADRILPPSSSQLVFRAAHQPKQLLLYEGAGHGLDEVADEVRRVVREWIVERLRAEEV
jgi:pimeloyl-ACP methyl ester carboxylesterase